MDSERLERLLDEALESGEAPTDADEAEREELLGMVATAAVLKSASVDIDDEVRASVPVARARFERFLQAEARPAVGAPAAAVRPLRRGFLGRWFGNGAGRLAFAGVAAAVVLAVGGLVGSQVLFTGVENAAAQVLQEGDYVQLEGVVSGSSGSTVTVSSVDFGTVSVDVSAAGQAAPPTGSAVVVSGIVGKRQVVAAQAVAAGAENKPAPRKLSFSELRKLRPDLTGTVSTFTINEAGTRGRVILEAANGERFLVSVDQASVQKLLELTSALGARVNVRRDAGTAGALFSLDVVDDGAATPADGAPRLVTFRGTVTARQAAFLTVTTPKGPVTVQLLVGTRIFLGESGLLRERLQGEGGAIIGHEVTVTGARNLEDNLVKASAVLIGPKVAPR